MRDPRVTVLAACTRDGRGGSPTAVMIDDATLTDDDRRAVAVEAGTSHAAVIELGDIPEVRFFTAAGELRNCGHGTIAAQAFLLDHGGAGRFDGRLRIGGRAFATTAIRRGGGVEIWFDQGLIELSLPAETVGGLIAALGLTSDDVAGDLQVASPGTRRLLVPVRERRTLTAMRPDFARLAAECRRTGYLGCFAYTLEPSGEPSGGPVGGVGRERSGIPPGEPSWEVAREPGGGTSEDPARMASGRVAVARMFAPAIGVDEDVVNANSAGCLAAHLLDSGRGAAIEVHQGDTLGRPSTVLATAARTPEGITTRIGGLVHYPACS